MTSVGLLEAALQVLALAVWLFPPAADARVTAGRTILCIGDSFTWGLGASRRGQSYPGQLQRMLRERTGQEWSVANGGWPGRDSRAALTLLPGQVRDLAPSWLVVLVGINDTWSQPEPVTVTMATGGTTAGFRLELRTWRLIRLILGAGSTRARNAGIDAAATGAPAPATQPATTPHELEGWWLLAGLPVHFAEGVFAINGAGVPFSAAADRFEIRLPGQRIEGTWKVSGTVATLELTGMEVLLHRIPEPDVVPPAALVVDVAALFGSAWQKMGSGDPAGAEKLFREMIAANQSPWGRAGLVAALADQGRDEEARRETEGLGADWRRTGDHAMAEGYMQALESTHRMPEALAMAEVIVRDRPDNATAWRVKGAWHKDRHEDAAATAAFEKAIALLADTTGGWRAELLRSLAEVVATRDPQRAIAALIEAYRCDHNRLRTIQLLGGIADQVRPVPFAPILAASAADAGDRKFLHEILASQGRPDPRHLVILAGHLRQIAAVCREQGIGLVVLGYPFPGGDIEDVQRKAAELAGAPFVPMWPRFEKELATRQRHEIFVGDGHCNDAGYGIMASLVRDAILPRLRS